MGSIYIGDRAGLENPETVLWVGMGMNRTVMSIAFAEGMVASGKYEEDEKSCQYEADCSTDRHLCQYSVQ